MSSGSLCGSSSTSTSRMRRSAHTCSARGRRPWSRSGATPPSTLSLWKRRRRIQSRSTSRSSSSVAASFGKPRKPSAKSRPLRHRRSQRPAPKALPRQPLLVPSTPPPRQRAGASAARSARTALPPRRARPWAEAEEGAEEETTGSSGTRSAPARTLPRGSSSGSSSISGTRDRRTSSRRARSWGRRSTQTQTRCAGTSVSRHCSTSCGPPSCTTSRSSCTSRRTPWSTRSPTTRWARRSRCTRFQPFQAATVATSSGVSWPRAGSASSTRRSGAPSRRLRRASRPPTSPSWGLRCSAPSSRCRSTFPPTTQR
mmetsp:Transcript_2354/g.8633  ORF Transcript_2354/g.8633 Transcript_2354/m.8633 type:complete len:313 (+) Transcript_2354:356-1294(+)